MSTQNPFILKEVDEHGNETVHSEHYYYETSQLHLTLQDMFLGTSKYARFRLYNNLSPEEDVYTTFSVLFDFSEGFTFGRDNVRYDTSFLNSLRKFIKISVAVGSTNSDVTTQSAREISSPFHVEIDTPIYGIIFFRNQDEFNAAVANNNLQNRYILVPYFPNPGEFISFSIYVEIPSVQEENFLEKALGFPIKQAEYKTPISAAEFSKLLMTLQQQYITGGTTAHQMLITYVGPIDTSLLIGGAARYPYIQGMLGRAANRGYVFSENGMDIFSNVRQPIIFSEYALSHGFFSESTSNNYYKGLPTEISTSGNTLSLIPNTSDRTADSFMLELTLTLHEILSLMGYPGEQPTPDYIAYATKLYDIISVLFSNYITASGYDYWEYNPDTHATSSPLGSFDAALTHIWASLFSHFLNALHNSFPSIFNTSAIVPAYNYVHEDVCLADYFNTIEHTCNFSYLDTTSIWQKTPSQILASTRSIKLLYTVFVSMSLLYSMEKSLLNSPGVTPGQKTSLLSELAYFNKLSTNISIFFAKHIQPWAYLIDETKASGSGVDLLTDLDTTIFPFFAVGASADFVLGLNGTIHRQFWHLIQKIYYYRGVFTEVAPMVLTHTKPVNSIQDGVELTLNDFDAEKSSIVWFLSNISEKEAEKLISLKMSVAAII